MPNQNDVIDSIAGAITTVENANPSLNNPGNIMDLAYYKATGQFRLQQYSSLSEGVTALKNLIAKYISGGYDLQGFFSKYAPKGHGNNDPTSYASTVSDLTGIPLGVSIQDYINTPDNADAGMSDSALTEGDSQSGGFDVGMGIFIGVIALVGLIIVNRAS